VEAIESLDDSRKRQAEGVPAFMVKAALTISQSRMA
jgi:hypothetical protein